MAKKQRVKTKKSLQEDQNRAAMEDLNAELDDSDDEMPEEVTFEDAKIQALESVKVALESTRREKELLKEKRRRRNELFQEQKKRKLLSAEVLEEIVSSTQEKKKRDSEAGDEVPKEKKTRVIAESSNLKGNYSVRTLKAPTLASLQQKAAEDFIQSRLYGPGTCRTTSCNQLSLQNKTAQKKSAAVDFVKKSWAPSLKAKSEKEKKRWLHRHQV